MKHLRLLLPILLAFTANIHAQTESVLRNLNRVQISISGVPDKDRAMITNEYVVNSQGLLKIPYIGNIQATGLTCSQLQERIEQTFRAKQIFTFPVVICKASEEGAAIRTVTVGGEVRRPSQVPFREGMTMYDAVTAAGGPTDWGHMKQVKLIRGTRETQHDMRRVAADPARNPPLNPDDKIVVPHR
ncbi:MAG TPA: SLBB domain-containing protein [Verrucomicrobiales bacterium]|nr:SLBB domain-containing protein [Verrucomicrobiales bacterium]